MAPVFSIHCVGRQHEAVEAGLCFKSIEFDGFKLGVVELLPSRQLCKHPLHKFKLRPSLGVHQLTIDTQCRPLLRPVNTGLQLDHFAGAGNMVTGLLPR